jgi:ferredoxin-thioredoxin reductase catalytic subunit
MNTKELSNKLAELVPDKEVLKQLKVVVARKKKRGGYDIFPCVKDVTVTNIPLLDAKHPVVTLIFES